MMHAFLGHIYVGLSPVIPVTIVGGFCLVLAALFVVVVVLGFVVLGFFSFGVFFCFIFLRIAFCNG